MAPTNIFHLPSTSTFSLLKRSCVADDGYVCYHIPIPAVIGIVLGCAFLLLVLGLTTFICVKVRRSRRKRQLAEQNGLERGEIDALGYRGEAKPEPMAWNPGAY